MLNTIHSEITLKEWIPLWLLNYKKNFVRSNTLDEYRIILNAASENTIGDMRVCDIMPIHIMQLYNSFSDYSDSYLHKLRFLLKDAFEDAVDNNLCSRNPARKAKVKSQKIKREKIPFTDEEFKTIIRYASGNDFGIIIELLLSTGMRSGEVRALTISQFNFEDHTIKIDRAVKRDGTIGLPKNNTSRKIPIPPKLALRIKNATISENGFIISDGGTHISPELFRRKYNLFFRKLNIQQKQKGLTHIDARSPHICRHTFSTILQRNGVPMSVVSSILGHKNIGVTQDYTHLNTIEDMKKALLVNDVFKV